MDHPLSDQETRWPHIPLEYDVRSSIIIYVALKRRGGNHGWIGIYVCGTRQRPATEKIDTCVTSENDDVINDVSSAGEPRHAPISVRGAVEGLSKHCNNV